MSIIEGLRNFILTCPELDEMSKVQVDTIDSKKQEYSIVPVPNVRTIKNYITGDSDKQYNFLFMIRDETSVLDDYLANHDFMDNFGQWLEEQTENKNFPDIGANKTPYKIESLNGGYMAQQDESQESAVFQISCTLLYRQKGETS